MMPRTGQVGLSSRPRRGPLRRAFCFGGPSRMTALGRTRPVGVRPVLPIQSVAILTYRA